LDGTQYNQPETFVKIEIPSSQTHSVDYQMEFVITKKLFSGPASKAPMADVLNRGILNPAKNAYE